MTTDAPGGEPGGPSSQQARERALDAASELFSTRGIGCTSMGEIAAATGISKRVLLAHFPSKDELILALMDRHVRRRLERAVAAFNAALDPNSAATAKRAWRKVGDCLAAATASEEARWQHLLFDYATQARHNPPVRAALARRRQEHLAAVAAQIAETAADRGLDLPLDPGELGMTILALSSGLALEAGINPDAVPRDLLGRVIALITGPPGQPSDPGKPVTPGQHAGG